MTRIVGPKNEELDRIRRHHEAFSADSWDPGALNTERRVFFILNRYSRGLIIMYASSACEVVLHADPDDIQGKPMLLFVRSDDLGMFVEQLDLVKAKEKIVNMKFWFQSPNWPCEIPCESVFVGSSDGILAVMRVCKPFVRKHFIADRNQSDDETVIPSQLSGSTLSSSPPPGTSPLGFNSWSPPHVSRSKLNQIKIFELGDDHGIRPVVVQENDPALIRDSKIASIVQGFKGVVIDNADNDDDESY
ncbi:hypothetical protein BGX26_002001 [Mortierella sp. AD094]|nr:hypothetical protein BGX26_002001 [Mortierella sp. AD094]